LPGRHLCRPKIISRRTYDAGSGWADPREKWQHLAHAGNTYAEDFAPRVRSDMKLDTLFERTGAQSLTELLKKR
jgi:hypothetical protein